MDKHLVFSALLTVLPLASVAAETAPPVRLVVGEMPPYSVSGNAAAPGLLVEITQELGHRVGVPLTVDFYPWPRALAMVSLSKRTLTLPLSRTPERENNYRWLLKIYKQKLIFVGLRANRQLSDPALLKQARLVVLRGTPFKRDLTAAGYTNVAECATNKECVRMVRRGIADATYGVEDVYRSAADNKQGEFRFSPTFRHDEVWLAGSLDFSDDDARKWKTALDAMRADGNLARIFHKYGISGN
ncbi:substrate-binding periplasmic protein [Duganella callida]|uniref:Transporter substrate-binding domain-containing protein n=1 Tax=Duganella callida TaxID=2561932 RepID=A0A4Y9SBL5_9BURK|nr:transporter substrate-binding domain-containing protein [Duganella callida]TFW17649.1 transporter substrate-binding domain-containing protein [Duganella callida]